MRRLATAHGPSTTNLEAHGSLRKVLLACGVAASLLYGAMNAFIPLAWPSYSVRAQTVSELSAIDAPTRSVWVALALVYSVLFVAFGAGVYASSQRGSRLRVVGASIIASGLLGSVWPPMHQRFVLAAGGGTLTDTLHIVWTIAWGALAIVAMGFGAAALGPRFRVYTVVTIVVLTAFGALASMDGPRVSTDMPTPWVGVWERINIASFYLWVVVFSIALLQPRAPRNLAATIKLLVGAGDRIAASTAPFAVVGLVANALWPRAFHMGLGTGGVVAGAVLLAIGVPLWITSAAQILVRVPKGKLITGGPFALVLHPLYTSVALLVIPGLGLVLDSWLGPFLGLVLFAASRAFERSEDDELAARFGDEYARYRKRVLLPWL